MQIEVSERVFTLYRWWLYRGPFFKNHRLKIKESRGILPPGFEFRGTPGGPSPVKGSDTAVAELRAQQVDEFTSDPNLRPQNGWDGWLGS